MRRDCTKSFYCQFVDIKLPKEKFTPDMLRAFGYTEREIEAFYRRLQLMQPEQIERNRRLMKAGMIEFDDYEEVE